MFEMLIERAVNRVLRLDPETLRRLGELDGKTIRLDLGGGVQSLTLFVTPGADGVRLRREHDGAPDVTLRGDIPVFARLARTGIAAGELQISGDIDLGTRFKRIFEGLDPDWEEPLARVIGDVAAHQVGRLARGMAAWGRDVVRSVARDTTEYLQEESRVLAPRARVDEFLRSVDRMRTDVERMHKRVEQLQRRRP